MRLLTILLAVAPALQAADGGLELTPKDWRIDVVGGSPQSARAILLAVPPQGFRDLRVSSTPLVEKDRNIVPNGALCVSIDGPRDAGSPCRIQAGPVAIDAGTPEVGIYLEPERLEPSGDYRAELRVTATGLEGPARTSLRIVVSDGPWLPGVVIFAGVAVGALIHFLAGRYRLRQQLALRLQKVRAAVEAWKAKARTPSTLLQDLESGLTSAETDNAAYLLTDKTMTALEAKAEEYRKELQTRSAALTARADKIQPALPKEKREDLATARRLIVESRLDDAEELLQRLEPVAPQELTVRAPEGLAQRLLAFLPRTPAARLNASELIIVLISAAVATCSGIIALYTLPFGRLEQYLGAFLWGLGIDSSLRGFRAVFQKLDS